MISRLWGTWEAKHLSPTDASIVKQTIDAHARPYLQIQSDVGTDAERERRDRELMCDEIVRYLNGGEPPVWLDDMERTGLDTLSSPEGAFINAYGPLKHRNGKLEQCKDQTSLENRTHLIDILCLPRKSHGKK